MPTWIIFGLVLSILVFVHEAGHFLAAKLFGIKVEEFAFGLPFTRPLIKFKKGDTQYSVYPLLFGGFVRLFGEESPVDKKVKGIDFWSRGKKQRVVVVVAGVIMNILLAVAIFGVLYLSVGIPDKRVQKVTVAEVVSDSPAGLAGIKPLDRIVAVEGKTVSSAKEFGEIVSTWVELSVNISIERGETTPLFEGLVEQNTQKWVVSLVPRKDPPEGQGALGVVIAEAPYITSTKCKVLSTKCILGIIKQGVQTTGIWIGRVFDGLRSIGKSLVAGKAPEGVSGPVGIYQLTGVVASAGLWPLLEMVATLSVNLGVFNLLPIPALDGGRAFMIFLEWLLKKRIPASVEQKINSWGMAFLLSLMALVSLQDVWRLWYK